MKSKSSTERKKKGQEAKSRLKKKSKDLNYENDDILFSSGSDSLVGNWGIDEENNETAIGNEKPKKSRSKAKKAAKTPYIAEGFSFDLDVEDEDEGLGNESFWSRSGQNS